MISLFDQIEQRENLARCKSRLSEAVLNFCRMRLQTAPQFRIEELQSYVRASVLSAPASPDRVLRALRKDGLLSYRVLCRRSSLYEVMSVAGGAE